MEQMGLFEAMLSQRQITRFKPDPVPREAIAKIIESATNFPAPGFGRIVRIEGRRYWQGF